MVVTFTTYSPSCVVSVFVWFLPKSAGGIGLLYLLISIFGCWYFDTFWVCVLVWVCVWVFIWVWFWFVLLSLTLVISVFVFVICAWVVGLFLVCDGTFTGDLLVVIVLVVFVYSVLVGLYVSYNFGGTIVLDFCCLVVIELYWVKLVLIFVVFFIDSVSNLVFGTEVEVYRWTLGFAVYDENFLSVVRSNGVLSRSWCVIESLFGFCFLTFLVSW